MLSSVVCDGARALRFSGEGRLRGHPRRWLFRHALGGAVAFVVGGQLAPATAAVCVKPGAAGCGRQSKAKCCAGAACKGSRCVCKPGRQACGVHCHPACSGRQRRDPTTCQCPAPSHGRHPRAAAGVAVAIHAEYDGQSLLALGVTFDANTLIPGDPAAIDQATAYLAASTTYQNQFTYGWGVYNTEPMPGIYNWASLDKRVALMASMQVQPVLTLVSAPDWMNYLAKPSNTNTISAVASPGSNISVTLGTPISAVSGGTSIIKADTILVDTDPNREQVFVKTAVTDGSRVIGFRADFAKPHPAGTPIVWGFSDFKGHPPTEAHFQEFADLAKATALRYPNVLHFKVWSELRGLWVTANCQYKNQGLRPSPYCADEPGIKNNWDYVAYTNLYNAVYDTLKRVNPNIRSAARIFRFVTILKPGRWNCSLERSPR